MSELRRHLLDAKVTMKCAWMELGRLLNEVVYGGDYKEWGFEDFPDYCAQELKLKRSTVQQLMSSYNYMKKFEAGKLQAFEEGNLEEAVSVPDPGTIGLLDKARNHEQVSEEQIQDFHRRAFSGEAEEPDFQKELRAMTRPAAKESRDPDLAEKAAVLGAARKLRKVMSSSDFVPEGLRERIEPPLVELEALV